MSNEWIKERIDDKGMNRWMCGWTIGSVDECMGEFEDTWID